ncbi:hypothetical protein [Bacillus glycinifermentans]|uniref:hypothetical protein n=1 Tax=Bacillus glycinifermentans TaxID=1664069 RepID=UPI001FF34E31|nr:hypothetical protein [Bacillus glycinifermentans]UOY89174.1 hypothetical protein MW696_02700 [Bacillus glycinifermentans]
MISEIGVYYKSLEQDTWSEDEFQVVKFLKACKNLIAMYKINTYADRFLEGIIPIAGSPFGNEIAYRQK